MKTWYWLIRRELWEHHGSLVRAPLIAALVCLVLNGMGLLLGEVNLGGHLIHVASMSHLASISADQVGQGLDVLLASVVLLIGLLMGFTVFFYALGALYDDRRDHSVLFWKSLPISNTQTVLSKVLVALVVAPAITLGVGLVAGLTLLAMASLVMVYHGLPLEWWFAAHPLRVIGTLLSLWPIYVLSALPTVGWLLLCSAWARGKPFLWAVVLPVGAAMMLTWLQWMGLPNLHAWAGLGQLLLGTFPMATSGLTLHHWGHSDGWTGLVGNVWSAAMSAPALWIGALLGVVLVAGAIAGRRRCVGA